MSFQEAIAPCLQADPCPLLHGIINLGALLVLGTMGREADLQSDQDSR